MLKTLTLQNLAIIESLVIRFSPGFNVMTGETGAGKSIIVGGLELALGERSSSDIIRAGADFASSEACFDPPLPQGIESLLVKLELEYSSKDPLVLRREISRSGKSRCFLNEQMIGVGDLKLLGEFLVDIHGQHEHQSLLHAASHRIALDAYAAHDKLLTDYRKAWAEVSDLRRRKKELEQKASDFEKHLDYLNFQIEEIEKLKTQPGEMAALELEEKRLAHAESLSKTAREAFSLLYGEESENQKPLLSQLGDTTRNISDIAEVEPEFAKFISSLGEIRINLEELAFSLRDYADHIQADPRRLDEVISRLESLRRLARKHGGSEESLFTALNAMRAERDQMTLDDEERGKIGKKLSAQEGKLKNLGERLRQGRTKAADRLKKKILSILHDLAMEKARFDILLEPLEEPCPDGLDRVEFLLAANPGLPSAPLRKVASGGEMSRVMLAIKSVLAERDAIPALVFDEIDLGISGEVCRRVGSVMEKLSQTHQIICITHQPAIAARAESHVSVRKTMRGGKTYTEIVSLEGEERVEELARMMGGRDTSAALDLARQLMK